VRDPGFVQCDICGLHLLGYPGAFLIGSLGLLASGDNVRERPVYGEREPILSPLLCQRFRYVNGS
jgi:hypothetical protein